MIADARVIENIKKLKELGMTNEEIIENLVKIGLSKEDSQKLIDKIEPEKETSVIKDTQPIKDENINNKKNENTNNKKEENTEKKIDIEKDINIKKDEIKNNNQKTKEDDTEIPIDFFSNKNKKEQEIKKKIKIIDNDELKELNKYNNPEEEEDIFNLKPPKFEEPEEQPIDYNFNEEENDYFKINETANSKDKDNDAIWQTGIITTINSKLNELEVKQKKFEDDLKQRISIEMKKINTIQLSSQNLLLNKITENINLEKNKIDTKVITELTKFKIIEAKLNNKITKLEDNKTKLNELITTVEQKNTELNNTLLNTKEKTKNIVNETEKNIGSIISTVTTKLNEKIKEINSTLALQSRITQGLVKNTQHNIDEQIKGLIEFEKKISAKIDPKKLYSKLDELENYKITLANRFEERFEKVKHEFLNKAKNAMTKEIEEELKEITKVRKEIAEKTDPEKINRKLEELRIFEEELLRSIDEKISQSLKIYEASISQEFRTKIKDINKMEEKLEDKINLAEVLQEKIDELDNFKKQFIAVIDKNIDKMNENMKFINNKIKEK